jgi:dihydroflavonol-4-reductase
VKALLRPKQMNAGLAGAKFDRVTGDVLDRRLLEREIAGCDWCFHVAASYQLCGCEITRRCMKSTSKARATSSKAPGKVGCRKIVYTSTVGCIGLPKKWTENGRPTDERKKSTRDR